MTHVCAELGCKEIAVPELRCSVCGKDLCLNHAYVSKVDCEARCATCHIHHLADRLEAAEDEIKRLRDHRRRERIRDAA